MKSKSITIRRALRSIIFSALIVNALISVSFSDSKVPPPATISKAPAKVLVKAMEHTPDQLLNDFIDSMNGCDLEKMMSLYADDATVFSPIPSAALLAEGKAMIEEIIKEVFDQARAGKSGPPYMNLNAEDVKTQIMENTAIVTFHMKNASVTSRRTLVLRHADGKWSIVHLHASNMRTGEQ